MDPDANLAEQKRLRALRRRQGLGPDDRQRLAELVQALNEWIQRGGFPPKDWVKKTPTAPTT